MGRLPDIQARLIRLAGDKHSSLFVFSICDKDKKFIIYDIQKQWITLLADVNVEGMKNIFLIVHAIKISQHPVSAARWQHWS
jgi:hypothetical protein